MSLQPLVLSTVAQALDGTTDDQLLKMIRMAFDELGQILVTFENKKETAVIDLGIDQIKAVEFVD